MTDGVRQELFVPSMLLIVLLLLGYIYICNDFSLREAGFYFVKAFINGEFANFCSTDTFPFVSSTA